MQRKKERKKEIVAMVYPTPPLNHVEWLIYTGGARHYICLCFGVSSVSYYFLPVWLNLSYNKTLSLSNERIDFSFSL